MLEELRISLFSQPMKTKMPISPTRLQSYGIVWESVKIDRGLFMLFLAGNAIYK